MVIDQKKLTKGLVFGLLGLYAFGVGFNFNIKTKGEYIRYLQSSIEQKRGYEVVQNNVLEQFNSITPNTSVVTNQEGHDVKPYISYSLSHDADRNVTFGEVHFCFIDALWLDEHYDLTYVDYWGLYADYSVHYMDVGDFEYNNQDYDIVDFLTTLSADNFYATDVLYQYGYYGFMEYDDQGNSLSVELDFVFKQPQETTWTYCSLFESTFINVTYLDEYVYYEFFNYSYLNSFLASNLNYSKNNVSSYQNGINEVLSHPNDYGLYTFNEYLAYGTSKYNEGLQAGSNVLSMSGVMNSIFSAPITMFMQIFNSAPFTWTMPTGEILDIGGIMTFFLTIGIALAIVRLIMKVGGK